MIVWVQSQNIISVNLIEQSTMIHVIDPKLRKQIDDSMIFMRFITNTMTRFFFLEIRELKLSTAQKDKS